MARAERQQACVESQQNFDLVCTHGWILWNLICSAAERTCRWKEQRGEKKRKNNRFHFRQTEVPEKCQQVCSYKWQIYDWLALRRMQCHVRLQKYEWIFMFYHIPNTKFNVLLLGFQTNVWKVWHTFVFKKYSDTAKKKKSSVTGWIQMLPIRQHHEEDGVRLWNIIIRMAVAASCCGISFKLGQARTRPGFMERWMKLNAGTSWMKPWNALNNSKPGRLFCLLQANK